jgi:UDP-N-acetylglucosamine 2-epimerase (non-hydrolysing)
LHFAPTETNKRNLLSEGINENNIFVTGNTGIDALFLALDKIHKYHTEIPGLSKDIFHDENIPVVLITGHRRENFGQGLESICRAIQQLALRFTHMQFVYPVHMNPNVLSAVKEILGDEKNSKPLENVHLIKPLQYLPFIALMERSCLILTDSGGVQEEAPSLGKPVLVMRDTTERPEAVTSGTVKLVGPIYENIVKETERLLSDKSEYSKMARAHNPYGDGKATERIVRQLLNY